MAILNWPEVVDDDSSGTTGTPFDAAYNEAVEAAVEATVVGEDNPGTQASEIVDEVIAARDGELELDTRIVRDTHGVTNPSISAPVVIDEVVLARDGHSDLNDRLDNIVDDVPDATTGVRGLVSTGTQIIPGQKQFTDHPSFEPGTSAGTLAPVSGVIHKDGTAHQGTGTAETDATTFTLPANVLDTNGKALRIVALFITAAGGSTRTFKVYWNGSAVHTFTTTAASGAFDSITILVRNGATLQSSHTRIVGAAGGLNTATPVTATVNSLTTWDNLAATLSGTVAIKTTVQDSAAGANITQLYCIIEVVG